MFSGQFILHCYITSIRGRYRTKEGCLIAEYQNAVNQTFLATGNRGGRNPLFVHSASLRECTSWGLKGTDEGRNQGQPWSCVGQCADSPSCLVARASTFGRRSLRADRFPTTPPTTVTGFLSNPFFASTSAFLPLLPRRLLLLLVQESGWSYPSYETHVCARIISSDDEKEKKEIPRVEEEERRILGFVRHFTCVRMTKGWS